MSNISEFDLTSDLTSYSDWRRVENGVDLIFYFFADFCNFSNAVSVVVDDDSLPEDYGVIGIPHKTLIKNGKIIANGSDVKEEEIVALLNAEQKAEAPKPTAAGIVIFVSNLELTR